MVVVVVYTIHIPPIFAFEHVISEPRPCVWAAENEKPLTSLPAMHRPHIPIPPRQHLSNYHPHTLTQQSSHSAFFVFSMRTMLNEEEVQA